MLHPPGVSRSAQETLPVLADVIKLSKWSSYNSLESLSNNYVKFIY